MNWQSLVFLSVSLYSINGLLHRTIMKDDEADAYTQAFIFTLLSSLAFFILILLFQGSITLPSLNQIILIFLTAVISSAGMVFIFKGFKSVEASEHTILLTSSRIWLVLGAILLLHESLTISKIAGTILILGGIVLAEWRQRTFTLNKGVLYVLIAAFFFAVGETFSFFIVRNFDVLSYMFITSILVVIILLIIKPRVTCQLSFYFSRKRAVNISVTSINDALANVFALMAYQTARNALQIGPIMATQTLVTVILAAIILKEKEYLLRRLIGSVFAVVGIILLT